MTRIPRIIHQTWRDNKLPEVFRILSETWREMLPGWEYRLWTDDMNREFVRTYYPDFLHKYEAYPKAIQRADAIRYLLLQTFGGLYVDLDFECLTPDFSMLLEEADFVVGKEPYLHAKKYHREYIICNALMASVPNHPFLKYVSQRMMVHPHGWNLRSGMDIVNSTGPFLLTDAYEDFPDKDGIRIVEPEFLYPIVQGEALHIINNEVSEELGRRINNAFAIHYFTGTWHGK